MVWTMVMNKKHHTQHHLKNGLKYRIAKVQKGFVLFFALIALVVMSLAAAALIRSVDTGVIVAGNLAFKQSATAMGDTGMVSAMTWIQGNAASLNATSAANGYYETSTTGMILTRDGGGTWPSGQAWSDATSKLATGSGFPVATPGFDPVTGNTVRYVIERMCRATGAASAASCLMGSASTGGNSLSGKTDPELGAITNYSLSPMYRITTRVTGPKNTISYIQAYVY
jgi:Tfp pilus assembly protein PilX